MREGRSVSALRTMEGRTFDIPLWPTHIGAHPTSVPEVSLHGSVNGKSSQRGRQVRWPSLPARNRTGS